MSENNIKNLIKQNINYHLQSDDQKSIITT
jgi:hypothetical protein